MSNNNPTPPAASANQKPNDPKPLNNGLAPVPLRRVGRLPRVIVAPAAPKMGGKRHTRRKHRKLRKTHRRRN